MVVTSFHAGTGVGGLPARYVDLLSPEYRSFISLALVILACTWRLCLRSGCLCGLVKPPQGAVLGAMMGTLCVQSYTNMH